MKLLAGIFYFLAFFGIMTVAHIAPGDSPAPAQPEFVEITDPLAVFNQLITSGELKPAIAELERLKSEKILHPGVVAALNTSISLTQRETKTAAGRAEKSGDQFLKFSNSLEKLNQSVSENTPMVAELSRKLDEIAISNAILKKQNRVLEKRLAKVEARPIVASPAVEPKPAPTATPEPKPAPRPTPRARTVPFNVGSINFSEPAIKILKQAAAEMVANDRLVASLRGSTTGFATSLGKGRAEAVKAKLIEFGVTKDRVRISEQNQGNGDSVLMSFSKQPLKLSRS